MEFYRTFVDILDSAIPEPLKDDEEISRVEIVDEQAQEDEMEMQKVIPTDRNLANGKFRAMALERHGKTVQMVKALATPLTQALRKPQRLLHDDPDYYVAIDCNTNTYYVCYRTLLMIDLDFYKDLATVDLIVDRFKSFVASEAEKGHPLRFKLYKSRNGVHGFLVSERSNYKDDATLSLQLELGSDFYYVVYSFIRGWSVRLNKKVADTSDVLYEFICDVGNAKPDEKLLKLVDLHLRLVEVFKGTGVNSMFGN